MLIWTRRFNFLESVGKTNSQIFNFLVVQISFRLNILQWILKLMALTCFLICGWVRSRTSRIASTSLDVFSSRTTLRGWQKWHLYSCWSTAPRQIWIWTFWNWFHSLYITWSRMSLESSKSCLPCLLVSSWISSRLLSSSSLFAAIRAKIVLCLWCSCSIADTIASNSRGCMAEGKTGSPYFWHRKLCNRKKIDILNWVRGARALLSCAHFSFLGSLKRKRNGIFQTELWDVQNTKSFWEWMKS